MGPRRSLRATMRHIPTTTPPADSKTRLRGCSPAPKLSIQDPTQLAATKNPAAGASAASAAQVADHACQDVHGCGVTRTMVGAAPLRDPGPPAVSPTPAGAGSGAGR